MDKKKLDQVFSKLSYCDKNLQDSQKFMNDSDEILQDLHTRMARPPIDQIIEISSSNSSNGSQFMDPIRTFPRPKNKKDMEAKARSILVTLHEDGKNLFDKFQNITASIIRTHLCHKKENIPHWNDITTEQKTRLVKLLSESAHYSYNVDITLFENDWLALFLIEEVYFSCSY